MICRILRLCHMLRTETCLIYHEQGKRTLSHYCLSQALLVLATTALPWVLHGAYLARGSSTPAPLRVLFGLLVWTISVYSLAGHKERRFLIAFSQVLQALRPLLRATPARAKDARANGLGRQSIFVCLPATDARVGLPFASAQAMSAAATLRGIDVLRREIRAAALSGRGSDAAESMRNIKVTVVDVGVVGPVAGDESADDLNAVVGEWTPSEKAAYGTAFGSLLEHGGHQRIRRQPSNVADFVETVVDVVSSGRKSRNGLSPYALRRGLGTLHELVRGDRVVVGAGGMYAFSQRMLDADYMRAAGTYALASYLPAFLRS